MIYILIWWLIGVASYIFGWYYLEKELSLKNIFDSSYVGLMGLMITFYVLAQVIEIKKIPQSYKDKWNKNLLNNKR